MLTTSLFFSLVYTYEWNKFSGVRKNTY